MSNSKPKVLLLGEIEQYPAKLTVPSPPSPTSSPPNLPTRPISCRNAAPVPSTARRPSTAPFKASPSRGG
ncbi:MAG: hypothetical protein Q9197_004686 [Variospora fuerteventurae]